MKYKKFYIVLLTLLMLHYIFWAFEFRFCCINSHLIASAILFVPIGLIILICILCKKEELKAKVGIVLSIILLIFFGILNIMVFAFIIVEEGTSYEDNPYRYNHIYKISGYKSFTYQFPDKMPKEWLYKNNVKFFYRPQFLQGGFQFELLIPMEIEEMDNYITKYNDKVKEVIKVTDDNIYDLDKNYGISKPFNVFDDYDKCAEYLVGSEIYLLDSKPYKTNNWNHGYVVYMAKNERLKQLLLVSEVW